MPQLHEFRGLKDPNTNWESRPKYLLWLDDVRNPFLSDWLLRFASRWDENREHVVWVKTYDEFCEWIQKNGLPQMICFDHDLGGKYSGKDAANWLVNYCMDHDLKLPEWRIQSANSVGRENIDGLLEGFKKNQG